MVREILPDLYQIAVPLPNSPLKAINSYVVLGGERPLVIDTGMRRPECEQALRAGLDELGVDLATTDLFITHLHADHMGLVGELATATTTVYFNQPDTEVIDDFVRDPKAAFERVIGHARAGGFPEQEIEASLRGHPGFRFSPPRYPPLELLADGDVLERGRFAFRCVATPGHTPGHLCLYEPELRLLVSGDHVLGDITPNITLWKEYDSLGDYLDSLDKVAALEVDLVLPGHRDPIRDLRRRVAELKEHHAHRLDEVRTILAGKSRTAYQVASEMSWDIMAESWEGFPVVQKWFAVGEAASHIRYLERRGEIRVDESAQGVTFAAG